MKSQLPQVVLVGRVNTGKSTLFNTLSEKGKAIVSSRPGTTRDLNFSEITWREKSFKIVDSGGLDAGRLGTIEGYVQKRAYQAIQQADLIVLVIDGRGELTAKDREITKLLKKSRKNILLAINKIDSPRIRQAVTPDFYKLGFDKPLLISALNGTGTGDLLDEIVKRLPSRKQAQITHDLKLSIIGKTNVGKSLILNAILGEERVIVTPLPHTTREPQDTLVKFKGENILLIDTAGLRKKRKITDIIETLSAQKTISVIKKSDVSLLITDVSQPLTSQDQEIAKLALKNQNGIIIVANKWDLIAKKDSQTIDKFVNYYQSYFPWLWWAPIIFVSALKKQRTNKLLPLALDIQKERQRIIDNKKLEQFSQKRIKPKKAKPSKEKKLAVIHSLKQTSINPPSFVLMVNHSERIHSSFLNFLEKKIRSEFGFNGTPINITLREER